MYQAEACLHKIQPFHNTAKCSTFTAKEIFYEILVTNHIAVALDQLCHRSCWYARHPSVVGRRRWRGCHILSRLQPRKMFLSSTWVIAAAGILASLVTDMLALSPPVLVAWRLMLMNRCNDKDWTYSYLIFWTDDVTTVVSADRCLLTSCSWLDSWETVFFRNAKSDSSSVMKGTLAEQAEQYTGIWCNGAFSSRRPQICKMSSTTA